MADLCTDNRFELIEKYKKMLIDATNIETNPTEMAVIDNILFRFWQMGWLDKLELDAKPVVRCKDCAHWCICHHGDNWFCADGTPINTASDYYDDKGYLLRNSSTAKGKKIP